jgi:hypothetical protein
MRRRPVETERVEDEHRAERAPARERRIEQVRLDRGCDSGPFPLEQRRDRESGGLSRLRRPEGDEGVAILGAQQPPAVAPERQPAGPSRLRARA